MLTGRLIRDNDAKLQFDVMSWLINRYGPPQKPKVPSPLQRPEQLSTLSWQIDDTRNVHEWAIDNFEQIKNDCGISEWSVQIAPQADNTHSGKHMSFSQDWNVTSKDPYYVDGYGRPIIHYDPLQCDAPGYFAARIILKLAEIKLMSFTPEREVSPLESKIMTLTAASYMRQGFTLAALPQMVKAYFSTDDKAAEVNRRIITNSLAVSTCTILLSHRLTTEQIVATYGTVMTKRFRKKIRPACKQIETYKSDIKLMRLRVSPPSQHVANADNAAAA